MARARGPSIPIGPGTSAGTQANAIRAGSKRGLAGGILTGTQAIVAQLTAKKDREFRAGERAKDRQLQRDRLAQDDSQFQQSLTLRDRQVALQEMKAAHDILSDQAKPHQKAVNALAPLIQSGSATPQQQQQFEQARGKLQEITQRQQGLTSRGRTMTISSIKG